MAIGTTVNTVWWSIRSPRWPNGLQVPDRSSTKPGRTSCSGFSNATPTNTNNTNITVDLTNPATPTLFIRNSLVGFQLLGSSATQPAGLDNVVASPATVTRTTTARLADSSAPISFSSVRVTLGGSGFADTDRWILHVNGFSTAAVGGDDTTAVATALRGALTTLKDAESCD